MRCSCTCRGLFSGCSTTDKRKQGALCLKARKPSVGAIDFVDFEIFEIFKRPSNVRLSKVYETHDRFPTRASKDTLYPDRPRRIASPATGDRPFPEKRVWSVLLSLRKSAANPAGLCVVTLFWFAILLFLTCRVAVGKAGPTQSSLVRRRQMWS